MMCVFRMLIVGMVILGHACWATADDAKPQTLRGHKKQVSSLTWSADGATLASAGDDRTIHLWNPEKGEATTVIPSIAREGYGAPVVAFSIDLKQAAVNYWGEITLLSIPEGKPLAKIDPILDRAAASTFRPDVYALAFSPDGRQLASAGSSAGQGLPSGIVIVWDVATGKLLRKFAPLATAGSAIAWSPDGKLLAAGTDGVGGELPTPGEILVWDASTGKTMHQLKVKPKVEYGEWASTTDVAFSPDGKRLAAPASAGSAASPAGLILPDTGAQVRAWSVASGESNLLLDGFAKSATRARFSADGTLLATAGKDHHVRLWDATSAEQKGSFTCVDPATALAFHPQGRSLAVGCRDGSIQIWPLPKAP